MLSSKLKKVLGDGIVLSVPIGIVIYLIIRLLGIMENYIRPITEKLGIHTLFGGLTLTIISLFIMFLFILLMGFMMQFSNVSRIRDSLENIILRFIPSLNYVKTLIADMIDREHATPGWQSVVLKLHDTHCFAFLVEETDDTGVFFHLKGTNLSSGETIILQKGSYHYHQIDTEKMRKCLKHFGKGASKLINPV